MENLEEIVGLLTLIVDKFEDAYSRPDVEIDLYEKYQSLREKHRVKVMGRFLVIDGGHAQRKSETWIQRSTDLKTNGTGEPNANRVAT